MSESEKDFFQNYCEFVDSVTSEDGKNDKAFLDNVKRISETAGCNFARLDMAIAGISGESGEIADLWKKIKFHGKDFNAENKDKLIKELGDLFWYLAQASISLNVPMEEIIEQNIEKLKARHPNGFNKEYVK